MSSTEPDPQPFAPASRVRDVELSIIRRLYERARELGDYVNLGLGEPNLPLPEVIREAATEALERKVIGYTPNAGLPELRRAIADSYRLDGTATGAPPDGGDPDPGYGPENVCVTCGSQEAMTVVLQTLVDPGDEVLVPDPGFVSYPTCVELAGGRPVPYPLPAADGFRLDVEAFARRLTPRTRAAIVNTPSNPTGRALDRTELAALAEALQAAEEEHGRSLWLISDEIYSELYYGERPPSAAHLGRPDRTVVLSGLSKSMCMTGWRLGWLIGPEELLRHAVPVHQYTTICAPTISQLAALPAFSPAGADARAAIRGALRQRRDRVARFVDDELGLDAVLPGGAFYLLTDVSGYGDCGDVAASLLEEARVFTVPGGGFGAESAGYLRLSFATEVEILDEGLRRLERGLRGISADP